MKKVLTIIFTIILILVIQTLPVFLLKPIGVKELKDTEVNVYYQPSDDKGATEIFDLVKKDLGQVKEKMRFIQNKPLDIYVYKTQFSLFIREAGFITFLFAPRWFIGDSENGIIRMLSPYGQAQGHTHDTILNGVLHEVVHSINYYKNPKISYFWDNGLATYLSKQIPKSNDIKYEKAPSINQIQTNNGLEFGAYNGYAYSYSYIDYLEKTYGWNKVVDYSEGNKSYEQVFEKTEKEIYNNWKESLQNQDN